MNVACYGDGADTTAVTVSGWTTAATNYIRIYTPTSLTEVGASQRHPGRWDTSKYRLEAADDVLWIEAYYVRIEGLQVRLTADQANVGGIVYSRSGDAGVSEYEVSSNIIRGNGAGGSDIRIGVNPYSAGSGVLKVWNNVIYDWRGGSNWVAGIVPDDPDYTVYVYNNTIVDCEYGIDVSEGTVIAKNNLAYGSALDNYLGAFAASSTHNLSGPTQADAPGSNPRNATTVTFVDAAADDFHLAAADTGAQGQGAELSADPDLAFAVDVDGGTRQAPWDIGADEQGAGALTCSAAARKAWYDAGWSYRQAIIVDHTRVVGDLVDFPVLISRNGDTDLAAHARPDGFDILFTDEDGTTKLSHQREAYDGVGNLVAWVKVPLLPTGADKLIFLYYGNPSSADQQSANATWSNGYQAVWHLSEASGSRLHPEFGPQRLPRDAHGHRAELLRQDRRGAELFQRRHLVHPDRQQRRSLRRLGPVRLRALDLPRLRLGRHLGGGWGRPTHVRRNGPRAARTCEALHLGPCRDGRAPDRRRVQQLGKHLRLRHPRSERVEPRRLHLPGVGLPALLQRRGGEQDPDPRRSTDRGRLLPTRARQYGGGPQRVARRGEDLERGAELRVDPDGVRQPELARDLLQRVRGAERRQTAVRLSSFVARGFESSVLVEWETAAELDNLGFHLYQGMSAKGPWTPLNASLIRGLGSSPEGRRYRWVDGGLANGTTYFYRLEDVDRRGRVTSHGPVSGSPVARLGEPGEGGGGGDVEPPGSAKPEREWKAHGDPTQQSLRVLGRTASGVTLELRTGGFYSLVQPDGTSKLSVPGSFDHAGPGLPTERGLVYATAV